MEVQRIPKRTVSVIEPQTSILVDKEKYHQKRVAAYCRVSTDSEEQLTSYQNQMRVYTEMIAAVSLHVGGGVVLHTKTETDICESEDKPNGSPENSETDSFRN